MFRIKKTPNTVSNVQAIVDLIAKKARSLSPEEALKFLFEIDNKLYIIQGEESVRYGNGVHTKHKHINYHKFFQDNIGKGQNVLDIGSSNGELTFDIAKKANPGKVIGIEIVPSKVKVANKKFKLDNLEYIVGDATDSDVLPENIKVHVITLSNVLEHIEFRVEFLTKLRKKYNPEKFLIRVPSFQRDWRVPLKKELGMDYRLDDTHYIEYTKETFEKEIKDSGLLVKDIEYKWGEIWAVIVNS